MFALDADTLILLANGFLLTLLLTIFSGGLALLLGLATAVARLSHFRRWRWPALIHIAIHRHVPALVIMIFWAFAVPTLFVPEIRQGLFFENSLLDWLAQLTNVSLPFYLFAAALGLILNSSAYIAELFRASIGTIPEQQIAVATTLGANSWHRFWRLLLPQGLHIAWPAITTRLIHNMKNTALASFLAVPEFFNVIQGLINQTFAVLTFILIAAAGYLLLAAGMTLFLHWIGNNLGSANHATDRRTGKRSPWLVFSASRSARIV